MSRAAALIRRIGEIEPLRHEGRVQALNGLVLEASGPPAALALGARARLSTAHGAAQAEVVGFRSDRALLMPFESLDGVRPGALVRFEPGGLYVRPHKSWLGRVIDAFGAPVDGKGPLVDGPTPRALRSPPPASHARGRVGKRIALGVRALDVFAALCVGQRMGIFAGSGVGKSVLMSMLARGAAADVIVIGLIGERGREVKEFIEDTLGEEGLARSVVVAATSDESALKRRQAAWMTMAVAEHFRDQGLHVLCLLDSVTRFAMAQREIGLAVGEPPTTKGYTPTVFSELPKLLERAGPGPAGAGAVTGLFTVLVDGGDHDEPVADAVRGILDGHIVMDRAIAERGRYPAIDILKSVSRLMPDCHAQHERELVREARRYLAAFQDMEELIRLGAYKQGSDMVTDRAIALEPALTDFLGQAKNERTVPEEAFARLAAILNG
jgi:flagellum-specific ATP synthase